MRKTGILSLGTALAVSLIVAASVVGVSAFQSAGQPVAVDGDDLGGVVTSPNGPEAGVWVIAETTDLPTGFIRIVVTDDQGRYLLPDLPSANYKVWVRGYGLVDSPKVDATAGRNLNLTAVVAPDARAAAQYYPGGYWYSLMNVPGVNEFPGTGPDGNGIAPGMESQSQWLRALTSGGCLGCHGMGNKAVRQFPEGLGHYDSSIAAWERRIQSGQAGTNMVSGIGNMGAQRALRELADWTDRIAAGEVPLPRRGPRGSSATWCSRCGTGQPPRPTCTT
jgi:hypothetical protein